VLILSVLGIYSHILLLAEAILKNRRNELVMNSDVRSSAPDAELIVKLIQQGHPQGEELLYTTLSRGLRYLAIHKLGEEGNDCFHEVFITLLSTIRDGALKDPTALFGYARTILKREIIDRFEERRKWNYEDSFDWTIVPSADPALPADQAYESRHRAKIMQEGLKTLRPKEREILVRYYLEEQEPEIIQREMDLTETQYRLLKSRSKQKLEKFTQEYLQRTDPRSTATLAFVGS
jgi:RNA polymerase sigma-70 factor, ECF subfamily